MNNMIDWNKKVDWDKVDYDEMECVYMEIDEVGMSVYDWFWDCMKVLNKWASLMDVWFKVERQFGENTQYGVDKANLVCANLRLVVMAEDGDEFWNE